MEKICYIVGGGPSLMDFDFSILKDQDTIVVNQAIFQVPHAKYFITMDYTWLLKSEVLTTAVRRNQFTKHPAEKFFILALEENRLVPIDEFHCIDKKFGLHYDLSLFDNVIRSLKHGGMGTTLQDFHSGSDSGFSALQLAVILGYKKIYLLGFDFCTLNSETHFHQDYENYPVSNYQKKLDEFLGLYPSALQVLRDMNIQVFSCSHCSKLNDYILYSDPKYL